MTAAMTRVPWPEWRAGRDLVTINSDSLLCRLLAEKKFGHKVMPSLSAIYARPGIPYIASGSFTPQASQLASHRLSFSSRRQLQLQLAALQLQEISLSDSASGS